MAKASKGPKLEQRDSGIYSAVWYCPIQRRERRYSLGTRNVAEAAARFSAWCKDTRNGMSVSEEKQPAHTWTVADCWAAYWREHVQVSVIGKETAAFCWKALKPFFGALPMRDVDVARCREYAAKRAVSGETVRRELSCLAAAANHCVKMRHITAADLPTLELPPKGEPRDRWLRRSELERLFAQGAAGFCARSYSFSFPPPGRLSRVFRFMCLAYFTAGRKAALFELRWSQVDLEGGLIYLNPPGRRQTKKRRATVYIDNELARVLERAHAERVSEWVLDHPGDIRTSLETLANKAGVRVTPHVFRATRATHLAMDGVPMRRIADLLGDTIATTERHYYRFTPEARGKSEPNTLNIAKEFRANWRDGPENAPFGAQPCQIMSGFDVAKLLKTQGKVA